MGHQVTIGIRAFPYYEDVTDPLTGQDVRKENIAYKGQTVEVSDEDYERGQRFKAFTDGVDTGSSSGDSAGAASPVLSEASVPELSNWLLGKYDDQTSKPTVDDVLAAVDDDAALAGRMIEAEEHASGGQSRSSLVEGLQKVVDAG
jgi:hypothetical protein